MGYGADHQLYGVAQHGELYRIDPTTGALTDEGNVGSDVIGGSGYGGKLYVASADYSAVLSSVRPPSTSASAFGTMTNIGAERARRDGPGGTMYVMGLFEHHQWDRYPICRRHGDGGLRRGRRRHGVRFYAGVFVGTTFTGSRIATKSGRSIRRRGR